MNEITKESILERLESYRAEHERLTQRHTDLSNAANTVAANINALEGAIQDSEYWLSLFLSETEEPDEN